MTLCYAKVGGALVSPPSESLLSLTLLLLTSGGTKTKRAELDDNKIDFESYKSWGSISVPPSKNVGGTRPPSTPGLLLLTSSGDRKNK